jgi:hypothetical protein
MDAPGVWHANARMRKLARELRKQLQTHFDKSNRAVWIAVQTRRKGDPDQYWIASATAVGKPFTEAGTVPGTRNRALRTLWSLRPWLALPRTHPPPCSSRVATGYDVGDMEIEIDCFQRINGSDERRIFRAWRRIIDAGGTVVDEGPVTGKKYTINSTELRMVNVDMQLVPPAGGVVHPEQLWEIPVTNELSVLDRCGVRR